VAAQAAEDMNANEEANAAVVIHERSLDINPPVTICDLASWMHLRGKSILPFMAANKEIEIKFRVTDMKVLARNLRQAGFHIETRRTHEMNTLYDLPGQVLRRRKQLLRLRQYGPKWTLTHKSGKETRRHSSREEIETVVEDGGHMELILRALGYAPSFRYEKFRAEWTDGKGQVVLDETPIGDFCEIEGPPAWIDATARKLGVNGAQYIMKNYATLFADWKKETGSKADEMTFDATK
jgi:adenylate cyclase, class 2